MSLGGGGEEETANEGRVPHSGASLSITPVYPPQDHSEVLPWPNTGSPVQCVALANGTLSYYWPGAAGEATGDHLAGLASSYFWQMED